MAHSTLQVGDQVSVTNFGSRHLGIVVEAHPWDKTYVVHNDDSGNVILSSLEKFAAGKPCELHKAATGHYWQRQEIATCACSLIGRKFDLHDFNCEQAANSSQPITPESHHVQGYIFVAGLIGLSLLTESD